MKASRYYVRARDDGCQNCPGQWRTEKVPNICSPRHGQTVSQWESRAVPNRPSATRAPKKTCMHALLLLAAVDANSQLLYVDMGRSGGLGDAYVWNRNILKKFFFLDVLMTLPPKVLAGVQVKPYFVGDAAFAASAKLMKLINPGAPQTVAQANYNSAHVTARRPVEIAFGRTKGRFAIRTTGAFRYLNKACQIILICCGLNNICEGVDSHAEEEWEAGVVYEDPAAPPPAHAAAAEGATEASMEAVRNALIAALAMSTTWVYPLSAVMPKLLPPFSSAR